MLCDESVGCCIDGPAQCHAMQSIFMYIYVGYSFIKYSSSAKALSVVHRKDPFPISQLNKKKNKKI